MKLNLFKGLAICLAIIGGAMATSSCSKEDHGLTPQARKTIERFEGEYRLSSVNWIQDNETRSGFWIQIDTTAKGGYSGEIKLDVIHDEDDYSKGTVRIEIPLYFYVNKFFTYFNAAVPNYYNSIPGGYVIQIKYEIDDLGAITFNPQGIDDGLDKFISGIKLNFDEEGQMLTLDLGTTFGEGWLSDLLNGLLKGFFQIVFEKEV